MARAHRHTVLEALGNSTVVVTAVVYGVLLRLAQGAGIFGLLLWMLVMLSLWRYGYAVLRHVATGWQRFPPPAIETMNPFGDFAVIFHSLLFSSSLYLLGTTPLIDGLMRWPLLLAVLTVFPASAAVMAMTRNAAAALNPVHLFSLVRELGADYAKLLAVSAALGALLLGAARLAQASWLLGFVAQIVAVWVVLALFLATGAALRANRFELDLMEGLDDAAERAQRDRERGWRQSLDRAYGSARSGLSQQAQRTLKELIDAEGGSLEIHQWMFNGMLAWDEPQHAALFGERFAARLWEQGRKIDALELVQRCLKLSVEFSLPPALGAELVTYARSLGRHRLADDLAASSSPSRARTAR